MSAGHRYRADGWCANAECFRHIADEPDLGFCPDTHGDGMTYRSDVPEDKANTYRLRKSEGLPSLTWAVTESPTVLLRSVASIFRSRA